MSGVKHTPVVVEDDFFDWTECWSCSGEGETESCFEDTCVCIDPPCVWNKCDVCRGKGGWPRPDEEAIARARGEQDGGGE